MPIWPRRSTILERARRTNPRPPTASTWPGAGSDRPAIPWSWPSTAKTDEPVNPYCFVQALFEELDEGDVVVTGDGTACVVTFQAADLKPGQRLFTNSGCASMGYDLPAAIGAALCRPADRRVICLAGDGSIMLNLQELQTIVGNQLPIKLFVLNNNGYSSIRQTQQNYFPDNVVGCGPESGLTFPDFGRLGEAFGFRGATVRRATTNWPTASATALAAHGPAAARGHARPGAALLTQARLPPARGRSMVSSPLEDLAPFLPRDELAENMLIPLVEE